MALSGNTTLHVSLEDVMEIIEVPNVQMSEMLRERMFVLRVEMCRTCLKRLAISLDGMLVAPHQCIQARKGSATSDMVRFLGELQGHGHTFHSTGGTCRMGPAPEPCS